MGFMPYFAPSLQLLLGVALHHEPFTRTHLVSLGLIGTGLAVYFIEAAINARRRYVAWALVWHAQAESAGMIG